MKKPKDPYTRHPYWIDDGGEQTASERPERGKRRGISFGVAFLIVVLLHAALVAGIYGANAVRKSKPKSNPIAAAKEKMVESVQAGPVSDALAAAPWPQPDAKPEIKAMPPVPTPSPAAPAIASSNKNEPPPTQSTPSPAPTVKKPPTPSLAVVDKKPATTPAPAQATRESSDALKKAFLATRDSVVQSVAAAATEVLVDVRRAIEVPPSAPAPAVASASGVEPVTAQVAKAAQTPRPVSPPSPPVVVANPQPERASGQGSTYVLRPGDNLYMVARRLGVSYNDLARANGIRDPRALRVGQRLTIPSNRISMR